MKERGAGLNGEFAGARWTGFRYHKIYLGDYIVENVQGVLVIGGAGMKEEISSYFPELFSRSEKILFTFMPEGICLAIIRISR